jgi:hypothetical protein
MRHLIFHKTLRILLAAAFFLLPWPGPSRGNELSDQRARIGIELFPSFLAADGNITAKTCEDGKLHLLLVHAGRKKLAREMANTLSRIEKIRGIPISIDVVGIHELENALPCPAAGIFLVERVEEGLDTAIRYGREQHTLLFSPFPGDVEKGVSSGMIISDRVLPYVNADALRLSGIHIKSFFLGIVEQYGE